MGAVEKLVKQPEKKIDLRIVEQPEPIHIEESEPVVIPFLIDALKAIREGAKWRIEVIGEWIGQGTRFIVKRLRGTVRAFWGAVWQGQLFPLRMQIVDFETGKDELVNARFIGRLSGLVVVSAINSMVLLMFHHTKFIAMTVLMGLVGLFSEYAWIAFQLLVVFGVTIYLPLGFWKARSYRGLKHLIVEELNRLTDTTKKCENSGE
jgi:uncharacterized membrane protein